MIFKESKWVQPICIGVVVVCFIALCVLSVKETMSDISGTEALQEVNYSQMQTTSISIRRFEVLKDTETDVCYLKILGNRSDLLFPLVNADGSVKIYYENNKNTCTVVEESNGIFIIEDDDTHVQYMIATGFSSCTIRRNADGSIYLGSEG